MTMAPAGLVASAVIGPGTEMTGGVTSAAALTVTVKVRVAVLPRVSVAVQVTVVVPIGNAKPEAGVHVGVIGPSTMSVAVAV